MTMTIMMMTTMEMTTGDNIGYNDNGDNRDNQWETKTMTKAMTNGDDDGRGQWR